MIKTIITGLVSIFFFGALHAQPLAPYGATPSESQLLWHDMEYYMFIHFGPNTFTNKEWGHGDEDPGVFNPTQLDCRQWVTTARKAGMKGIIITAKHHDGFCLWPSRYSTHTVRESRWKDGHGDVLRELATACREQGLKFGVYLSPWDRNHPDYGTPQYNQVFVNMLEEVLGNYGPVFEQWFDGANGEGPNGKKQVYDWKLFNGTVYRLQPQAIIFSDGGPGCRWVGNENGFAGETNWCTLNAGVVYPGFPHAEELTSGHEDGNAWIPAECDVSIRPGWFYSPQTDDKVKSLKDLMEIYYRSIGRGANLLLNVPVDRRGLIAPQDSARLMEFRNRVDRAFAINLSNGAEVVATSLPGHPGKHLTDGDSKTTWAPEIQKDSTSTILVKFKSTIVFNRLVLQEDISLGQRIKEFSVEVDDGTGWKPVEHSTTIGHKRILRLPTLKARFIRIKFLAKDTPVISELAVYFDEG